MIALGGVIGAGLFVGASSAIASGGPGVIVVYAACGVLVLVIMRMLGEMAVAQPGRGSFAEYASVGLGPWAGFMIRWLYWYCQMFGVGAETAAGAKLLHEAGVPGPLWAVGLALIGIMTLINLLSVRAYGELEFWLALLKVSAIAAFIAIGFAFVAAFGPGPKHAVATATAYGGIFPKGFGGLLAAIPIVIFSMFGSEMATIAAAESKDPAANIARAGRSVALRIAVFYVASVGLIVAIVPWTTISPGLSPFATALDTIGIPAGGRVMSMVVIIAVLSALNSAIYVSSRMLHELGKNGDGPRLLASTARNKTPWVGVSLAFAFGSAAMLAQMFADQDVFTLLAGSAGAIMLFIYALIVVAQIRLRRRAEAGGEVLSFKVWLFPWLSYATILLMLGVLAVLASVPGQLPTLAVSGTTIALVAGGVFLRKKGREQGLASSVSDVVLGR